jgi:hypothetical protein
MSEELGPEPHELQEQVLDTIGELKEDLAEEKAEAEKERQGLNLIALSTGILSALAAIAAMTAGSLANEGMVAQMRATDQWAFYQAKSTKRHLNESTATLLKAQQKTVPAELTAEINKLRTEQNEIQAEAQKLQSESEENLHRHELFARSVAALQVGISLGAVAALLRKPLVWYLGLGIAAIGIGFMVVGSLPGTTPQAQVQRVEK